MTMLAVVQLVLLLGLLILITRPLGGYIDRVFAGEKTFLAPVLRPVEKALYRASGVNPEREMRWNTYAIALLVFNAMGALSVFVLQRIQASLPFNPDGMANVESRSAFNTAVSFMSNTNWQGYGGEITMSYFTQMAGLTVQNFVSAATGIAIAIALIRGFVRHSASQIGNFWTDLIRGTLYILLPMSIVFALALIAGGVPQTLSGAIEAVGITGTGQSIAIGPVASQEAIKLLGTNGGGFFNANSAHPFENPNALINFLQMLSIFAIPVALTYTFGRMVGNSRQGWEIFASMTTLFVVGAIVSTMAEQNGNSLFQSLGIDSSASAMSPGGNLEGKEMRLGVNASTLFAVITTAASCGAVNAMHDSFMPIGGLIPLLNMGFGEVIFGGVGAGMYGILVYAVIAIFIAGLMVGRTPEYLGKKIEGHEVKMAMLTLLVLPLSILGFTSLAIVTSQGTNSIWNPGPHGLSEILYAFTSATGNNGSAFAGLAANTPFYNITLGLAMLIGRFFMIVPILALAGSLAKKKRTTTTSGTLPTTGGLWIGLLTGVIVIVGALTYFPAYGLGPLIEHSLLANEHSFSADAAGSFARSALSALSISH